MGPADKSVKEGGEEERNGGSVCITAGGGATHFNDTSGNDLSGEREEPRREVSH